MPTINRYRGEASGNLYRVDTRTAQVVITRRDGTHETRVNFETVAEARAYAAAHGRPVR